MYVFFTSKSIYYRVMRALILTFAFGLISSLIFSNGFLNKFQPTVKAASTFNVNSLGDGPDIAPGDGLCADSLGSCTLRAAIQEANSLAGDDTIGFLITGTINLTSALPDLATNITINGLGSNILTVQRSTAGGTPRFRIFTIAGGATTVNISGLTISNGHTADGTAGANGDNGGAVLNNFNETLNLTNVAISGNATGDGSLGGYGGGIFNNGTVILSNSSVTGNRTGNGSGPGGVGGQGGGIYNVGTVTITNSAVLDNLTGNGLNGGGDGGGISSTVTLSITNSTISGNRTGAGFSGGGGIWASGTLTLSNTTISGNQASSYGGGLATFNTATLTNISITNNRCGDLHGGGLFLQSGALALRNTVVGGNFLGASPSTTADDISGTVDPASSFNLIGTGGSGGLSDGVNNNQVGVANVGVGPLAYNGGPTQTHALLAGSPAMDAGSNANLPPDTFDLDGDSNTSEPIPYDQRGAGFARIVDGPDPDTTDKVDIGAFEAQVSVADIVDQAINEDGSLSLPFNVGGAASITSVTATSSNTTLVPNNTANISISGSGSMRTLLINPVANAFGTTTVTVTVNGNNGQTMTDTFLLTVNPVNESPSFTKGPDQTVNENDGAKTISNWASNISAGPANESGQTLTFIVATNSNPALFTAAPAISATGTLTYTLAAGVSGTATISIVLKDNGGTANGGADTSAIQTFHINVLEGGTLGFSTATYSVSEGAGSAVITIARSGGSAGTATVLFATSSGTATAADYTSVSQIITFNDGEVSKTVNVAITDDLFKEPDETVNLTLSNAGGSGQLGTQTTALLTIVDDDPVGGYVRFSSADFNTTESSGSTTIAVERVGDTSQAVTVSYATAEDSSTMVVPCPNASGIASSRCDFTTALGTLRFAAGESSKTFAVLISQDNYVEGPEALTLTLANLTGGAAFATPSTATLMIADDATEPATNPIDMADGFVRQHYHDFLNREPDAAGLAFWTNEITSCGTDAQCIEIKHINVSASFFLSIEFQETGYLVYRMYKAAYDNLPSAPVPLKLNEFLPDTQQIGKGLVVGQTGWEEVLENNKQAFAAEFVLRSRFTSAYVTTLTPAQFVDALYANAGVTPSAAEQTEAINEFGSATTTSDAAARARVLRRVAENLTLAQQEFNKAFVLMEYFGYLRRNPNDAPEPGLNFDGYNFWLGKLNQFNGNFVNAELVKAFIISNEYRQRFGP